MKESEIIKAWKKNDRYFASGNITNEMKEFAWKNPKQFQVLALKGWVKGSDDDFYDFGIYRLRPDYQPEKKEPEIIEVEIKLGISLKYILINGQEWCYTTAPAIHNIDGRKVRFLGYRTKEFKELVALPLGYVDKRKTFSTIKFDGFEPATYTHAVFEVIE